MNVSSFIRRLTIVLWTAVAVGVQGETRLSRIVPVLDMGGRDATTTFAPRGICDAPLTLVGSWAEAQMTHFADDGIFDQIYRKAR